MARSGVDTGGARDSDEEVDVKALAAEQAEQRRMLRALQRATLKHFRECGALQITTAKNLGELAKGLHAIEARFETFDKICGFVARHGKKILGLAISALITAYVGILTQNFLLQRDTAMHAQDAAVKAVQATTAIQTIPARTVQELNATRPPAQ